MRPFRRACLPYIQPRFRAGYPDCLTGESAPRDAARCARRFFGTFATRTRAARLSDPTQLAGKLFEAGKHLLSAETDGTRFRLIGIGLSDLGNADAADPADLADPDLGRKVGAERAVDRVRAKFGRDMVQRGLSFSPARKDK